MAAHFIRRYIPGDITTSLPQSVPTACAPTQIDNLSTIRLHVAAATDIRHDLVTSVQTWLPHATAADKTGDDSPSKPPRGHGKEFASPIEIFMMIFIIFIFAGILYYLAQISLFACCQSLKKRRENGQKRREWKEIKGESPKDRAARRLKWHEDNAEEGVQDVKKVVKDAGKNIKDAGENMKKQAKDDFKKGKKTVEDGVKKAGNWIGEQEENAADKLGKAEEAVEGWAEQASKSVKKFFGGDANDNKNGEYTALLGDKKGKDKKGKKNKVGKLIDNTDGASDDLFEWPSCQIQNCETSACHIERWTEFQDKTAFAHTANCGGSDAECGLRK